MLGAVWVSGERKERRGMVVESFMVVVLGVERVDCRGGLGQGKEVEMFWTGKSEGNVCGDL